MFKRAPEYTFNELLWKKINICIQRTAKYRNLLLFKVRNKQCTEIILFVYFTITFYT